MSLAIRKKTANLVQDFFYLNKFREISDLLNEIDSKLDRRFFSNLAIGILKQFLLLKYHVQIMLDYKKPLPPFVEANLITGAYQLFFMDKTPSYSIINDTVEIVKKSPSRKFSGLVNAVLRKLERVSGRSERFLLENIDLKGSKLISVKYSHPLWLVERWINEFGYENTEKYCQFNQKPYPHFIRPNLLKSNLKELQNFLDENGIEHSPAETDGILLISKGIQDILNSEYFLEGNCIIQDESSVMVARIASENIKSDYIDLCAAPGLKTQIIMESNKNSFMGAANEIESGRFKEMIDNFNKWNVKNISTYNFDALEFPDSFTEKFSTVLIDAPCSNLGVIAAKPDIRWRRSESDLNEVSQRQLAIIQNSAKLCKPGGNIIYITCSIEKEETTDVIEKFLNKTDRFTIRELKGISSRSPEQEQEKYIMFYPFKISRTGFFIVNL
ncbi:MAG: 16S rRNA (cytosine(967)-C(5))-methyltransferase RsmB, partial [bacterium]|nr:16S rRNA (cytosine(967)-C(5))-methyltransferase RsmB [bacterium]